METQCIDDKMHMEYNYIIDKKHKTVNDGMGNKAQQDATHAAKTGMEVLE